MAATHNERSCGAPQEASAQEACLGWKELSSRLEEEISRASRQGWPLGCLLVRIEDLGETIRPQPFDEVTAANEDHLVELGERALAYASVALRRQLRRYDRVGQPRPGELFVLLPGVDGVKGERVARRSLERLRALKVEVEGERRPLHIAIGMAAWREGLGPTDLLRSARIAVCGTGDESGAGLPGRRHS